MTGIGVLLVGVTLYFTWRATQEAGNAARSTADAVEVTRRFGEAQTRAYLVIDAVDVTFANDAHVGLPWGVRVIVTIVNAGAIPAMNIGREVFAENRLVPEGDDSRQMLIEMASHVVEDIAPGRVRTVFDHILPLGFFVEAARTRTCTFGCIST